VKRYKILVRALIKIQVLEKQPENVKALFRSAQAFVGQGKVEKAKEYLNKAAVGDPNDKSIQQELQKIKQKEIEQKQKEKQMYSKMFS
jgi:cytochrome c-type biogenesis protein CcmH/NrfG